HTIPDPVELSRASQTPSIHDKVGGGVSIFKFLGVHITEELTWSEHTTRVVKKAQQRLLFLRRLRRFGMDPHALRTFYTCTVESVLTGSITTWCGSCTAIERKALQRVVRTAQCITGVQLPNLLDLYSSRCLRRTRRVLKDSTHPSHRLLSQQPSGRSQVAISSILDLSHAIGWQLENFEAMSHDVKPDHTCGVTLFQKMRCGAARVCEDVLCLGKLREVGLRVSTMGVNCAVPHCTNKWKKYRPLRFFRLPIHQIDTLKQWLVVLNIDMSTPFEKLYNVRVCSDHFCEDDYSKPVKNPTADFTKCRLLKKTAVPTISFSPTEAGIKRNLAESELFPAVVMGTRCSEASDPSQSSLKASPG
ncbi:hypothetical protein NFI96_001229, partial [Prochilodus magdalenae]